MSETSPVENVVVNEDTLHDNFPVRFRFNKVKDKESGEETQRAAIELSLKTLSLQGIAAVLASGDEKQQSLLLDAVKDVIVSAAKDQINSNESLVAESFDHSKVTWEAIANTPNERKARGIPKELWDEFYGDYEVVYKTHLTDDAKIAETNINVWKARLQTMRGKLPLLKKMQDRLAFYTQHTERGEEFSDIVKYLNDKLEEFQAEGTDYGLEKL